MTDEASDMRDQWIDMHCNEKGAETFIIFWLLSGKLCRPAMTSSRQFPQKLSVLVDVNSTGLVVIRAASEVHPGMFKIIAFPHSTSSATLVVSMQDQHEV